MGFTKETITDVDLQGVSIFARGKLAQAPFLFNHTGGSASDFATAYLSGQMIMDFVDDDLNLISPERQRIDFDNPEMKPIEEWGQKLIDKLSRERKKSRADKRQNEIFSPDSNIGKRLSKMPKFEQKQITPLIKRMSEYTMLGKDRLEDWALQTITAYEHGRLYELLEELSKKDEFEDSVMIEMLKEAGALTDLQIGETVKMRILVISEIKRKIHDWEKENDLRDYIAHNPWLISAELETAASEAGLLKTIKEQLGTDEIEDSYAIYNGRIDLLLRCGGDFTLVEFMRPGKPLDFNHVSRMERYVEDIANHIDANSGKRLKKCLVIADMSTDVSVQSAMKNKETNSHPIFFKSWSMFLADSESLYRDQIKVYKARNVDDDRIQSL